MHSQQHLDRKCSLGIIMMDKKSHQWCKLIQWLEFRILRLSCLFCRAKVEIRPEVTVINWRVTRSIMKWYAGVTRSEWWWQVQKDHFNFVFLSAARDKGASQRTCQLLANRQKTRIIIRNDLTSYLYPHVDYHYTFFKWLIEYWGVGPLTFMFAFHVYLTSICSILFTMLRDELEGVTEYSEAWLPILWPIIQEFMAKAGFTLATRHLLETWVQH